MTILGIFGLLGDVFKFFDQVTWFIKVLKGTPEQHHQAVMDAISAEAIKYSETGRPTWN